MSLVFTGTPGAGKIHVMKFATVLDRDEDGMWIAECPSIPGCVSQGKTREEALANIKEAIALCLEVRAERGMPRVAAIDPCRLDLRHELHEWSRIS
jgi:predicted RNase H-like HicB family nuclease